MMLKELLTYLKYGINNIKINSMKNKQTAVEWFIEELFKKIDYTHVPQKLIDQAKQMEKEQKIMDYEMGYINGGNQKKITGEQYYNETYGNLPNVQA